MLGDSTETMQTHFENMNNVCCKSSHPATFLRQSTKNVFAQTMFSNSLGDQGTCLSVRPAVAYILICFFGLQLTDTLLILLHRSGLTEYGMRQYSLVETLGIRARFEVPREHSCRSESSKAAAIETSLFTLARSGHILPPCLHSLRSSNFATNVATA